MREFTNRHWAAQVYKNGGSYEVVFSYGGTPHRRVTDLDEDVALHIAKRWARSGHLPEDPYVPTPGRAA